MILDIVSKQSLTVTDGSPIISSICSTLRWPYIVLMTLF